MLNYDCFFDDQTALAIAASRGDTTTVKLLLESKASVDIPNKKQQVIKNPA